MARRVPVLRQHPHLVVRKQRVDRRHDLVAAGDGKCAARAEIVLHVDDDQGFVGGAHGRVSDLLTLA